MQVKREASGGGGEGVRRGRLGVRRGTLKL